MTPNENYRKRAAALQYDSDSDHAPKLTASGKGYVAEEIIERAKANNIPIQSDPSLVTLLSELNINEQIPEELYHVVAEVFAYIYQVDKKAVRK
ncbi:EscU/YscU/HrcU family type III secretion system export apparatus switch protein [Gracilibacillus caseinilyticus]|uniref:EscU/YscU/HrcU family type III secretion system export apparatus switch protein n=1 Tax=Gracilibacillus caseinilyticus TaxID=2932256 RepID=A0ABY4EVL2_9BACI|nr:EscU/YscU/HrcU family type III secretion system export apparatus switch protein [Gracilibacillus caseinilyticus]UOQ47892.1 EscU/YscU/HrcU family type III secretion system export apparatus switch protein [Gracilibacillus caseinilyticus]